MGGGRRLESEGKVATLLRKVSSRCSQGVGWGLFGVRWEDRRREAPLAEREGYGTLPRFAA